MFKTLQKNTPHPIPTIPKCRNCRLFGNQTGCHRHPSKVIYIHPICFLNNWVCGATKCAFSYFRHRVILVGFKNILIDSHISLPNILQPLLAIPKYGNYKPKNPCQCRIMVFFHQKFRERVKMPTWKSCQHEGHEFFLFG